MRHCILVVLGLLVACRTPPPAERVEAALTSPSNAVSAAIAVAPPPFQQAPMPVVDVIDGDTLIVDDAGRRVTVHLLGIDAPEIAAGNTVAECFGREAADLLRVLAAGRFVQLSPHTATSNGVDEPRRYVYLVVDAGQAVALNWALVWQGYARTEADVPHSQEQETFRQAEQAARESSRGLWASTTCDGRREAMLPG